MVHPKYAFGKINAEKLVTAARSWVNVGPQIKYSPSPVYPEAKIPYTTASIQGYIGAVTIDSGQTDITALEHVQVSVSLTSSFRGGLVFELRCPSGTNSVLLSARPYDSASGAMSWTFMTTRCWDESPIGTWHLFVYATNPSTNGFLKAWSLIIYGSNKSATKSCKTSEYLDANDNCSPCDSTCGDEGCIGQGPALCRNCLNFKVNGICFNDCPDGYYPSLYTAGQCEVCNSECATCTGPGANQCLTCSQYTTSNSQGIACSPSCGSFQFSTDDKFCHPCNAECAYGCTGSGADQCIACLHYKNGDNCVQTCPNMTYPLWNDCKPCDAKCSVGCAGPGSQNCTNCVGYKIKTASGFDCIDACPLSKTYDTKLQACVCQLHLYQDDTGVCQHCNPECSSHSSCSGPDSSQCIGSCAHVQYGSDCVPECPPHTYASGNLT